MRPGQTAPECPLSIRSIFPLMIRFNEAGADCPGMLIDGNLTGIAATALQ